MSRLLTEMDEAADYGVISVDQRITLYRIMAVIFKQDVVKSLILGLIALTVVLF